MRLRGSIVAGVVVATVGLSSCSGLEEEAGAPDDGPTTCEDLAADAVRISEDQDVQLLKVRGLKVDLDKQESGWDTPTGTDEVVVMRCTGRGVWSDGSDSNVRVELRVDADDDAFVYYKETL